MNFSVDLVISDQWSFQTANNSFISCIRVGLAVWAVEMWDSYWSNNDRNTSDSEGLHFNTKVWQDSSWGKILYWIAQLACDQTLGWEIVFLSWHLSIYLFREKKKKCKEKKINQALEMRQRRLQADRCLVTHAVTKNLNVRPEEMRRTPSQVDQLLCSTCVTAVEMQVIGRLWESNHPSSAVDWHLRSCCYPPKMSQFHMWGENLLSWLVRLLRFIIWWCYWSLSSLNQ